MKIEEWIDKSQTHLSKEEVEAKMDTLRTIWLNEESFVTYDYTADGDVVVHFLNAPQDWALFQDSFTEIFKGRMVYFLTRRNPKAWERLDDRVKWQGYMMQVDLR